MNLSTIPESLRTAIAAGAATLALTANVQAQYRPIIEPAYMAPPGAVGTISGLQLMDQGGVNQLGGYFVDTDGSYYVRTSPHTIHQVSQPPVFYPQISVPHVSSQQLASVPPIQHTVSPYPYPKAPSSAYASQSAEQFLITPIPTSVAAANQTLRNTRVQATPVDQGEPPHNYTLGNVTLSPDELAFMAAQIKAQVAPCKEYGIGGFCAKHNNPEDFKK